MPRHGYECKIEPQFEGGWDAFTTDLTALFSKYFDPQIVEEEFALPRDFQDFLLKIQGCYLKSNCAGVYDMQTILSRTVQRLPNPELLPQSR